jgi:hypothetical protein
LIGYCNCKEKKKNWKKESKKDQTINKFGSGLNVIGVPLWIQIGYVFYMNSGTFFHLSTPWSRQISEKAWRGVYNIPKKNPNIPLFFSTIWNILKTSKTLKNTKDPKESQFSTAPRMFKFSNFFPQHQKNLILISKYPQNSPKILKCPILRNYSQIPNPFTFSFFQKFCKISKMQKKTKYQPPATEKKYSKIQKFQLFQCCQWQNSTTFLTTPKKSANPTNIPKNQ